MALGVRDRRPTGTQPMQPRRGTDPEPPATITPVPTMSPGDAARQAYLNGQKAVLNPDGTYTFVPLTGAELAENQRMRNEGYDATGQLAQPGAQGAQPAQPELPTDPMAGRPAAPLTPQQAVARYGASVPAFEGAVTSGMFGGTAQAPLRVSQTPSDPRIGRADMGGVAPGVPPAAEQGPAEADQARINALLGKVGKATSGLMALGQRDLAFSQAQAQLRQGLEQGQRQALSLARSGNRRDRAANESRAIQAGTELAAQTGQAAAGLRATEEAAQQQIRLDAYKAAGDLGLNAGALDLNVQQLDMNAATNFLNQLFQRENLQLQIDQQEAERVTNFIRDMALLERDYYTASQAERDAVREDLTRRYGISEQTRLALTQLDKSDDINWGQLAISGIGGLITGSAQVGAALATKSATGGAA